MSSSLATQFTSNVEKAARENLLTQYGLPLSSAKLILLNDLANWSTWEIAAVFSCVSKNYSPTPMGKHPLVSIPPELQGTNSTSGLLSGLKSVLLGPTPTPPSPQWQLSNPQLQPREEFVKPPTDAIAAAAREEKALCINIHGEWSLRTEGYVALSHVWIEGIQSDPNNRGFDKKQLGRIIHKLQNVRLSTGCKIEWLWLDTIAIPTGGKTGNLQEEIFKTEIINSLATIYRNAGAVVIFDALTLQLHPRSLLDVAVALLCGKWMTRVWRHMYAHLTRLLPHLRRWRKRTMPNSTSCIKHLLGSSEETILASRCPISR
jgi:hypothetical protein